MLILVLFCLAVRGGLADDSRACIDDSDCVDLGHKFACFLYKCYNWQEPGDEHPHCRYDWDCQGKDMECYRHWNLRMVNKGLCFSSYSLSQCHGHSSCRDGERCCGSYCCPMSYYSQWRNFTCSSDLQCTTLRTGDACCQDNKCCWREDNQVKEIKDIKEEKLDKHEEEDLMDHVEQHQEEEEPVLITDVDLEENKYLEEELSVKNDATIGVSEFTENETISENLDNNDRETKMYAAMNNATEMLMHDHEKNIESSKSHDYIYNNESDETEVEDINENNDMDIILSPLDDNNIESVLNETSPAATETANEKSSPDESSQIEVSTIDQHPTVHLLNGSNNESSKIQDTSIDETTQSVDSSGEKSSPSEESFIEESSPSKESFKEELSPSEKSFTEESSPSKESSVDELYQIEGSSIEKPSIAHLWNISHEENKEESSTPVESNEIDSIDNYILKDITTEGITAVKSDEIDKDVELIQDKEVSFTMKTLPPRTLQTSVPSIDNDSGEVSKPTVSTDFNHLESVTFVPNVLNDKVKQNVGVERDIKKLVKLSVGGKMFETFIQTLDKEPNTILAGAILDDVTGVYHVDACPKAFKVILGWLRYGEGLNMEKIPDRHLQNVAKSLGIYKSILHV